MHTRWRFLLLGIALGVLASATAISILAAMFFAGGFSARTRPGALEASLAHFALRNSVPKRERGLRNPVAESPEMLEEAMNHYADHCANCHANNGDGHTMYGDGMNPPPPDLRLASTQGKTDGELYSIIQNGVRMSGMPAFGSPGEEDQSTWKLVAFIRHLPSLTAVEKQAMEKANPVSPSELEEQREEDDFLRGNPKQPKGPKQ
jgi:mono/diheme cytochrome c family protein